ncbi:MAG: 3-hydroxyacyl-CoA dehydrogenase NAD-binding domain-containing protein [Desulfuromonadaceae bacterium]
MQNLRVGILGAGTMGKQLALLCASRNIPVVLWNHRLHDDFVKEFGRLALIQAKLGVIAKDAVDSIVSNVSYVEDMQQISSCNFIIESVKENMGVKAGILSKVKDYICEGAIIASNTSTLSITELASQTTNPSSFVGIHFFNPPMSMKLVEVVRGEFTSDDTVDAVLKLLQLLEKHPVVLPESPGFVVNRLLFPMINEAIFLLSEGISDEKTIDSCMQLGANHPMGPLELADFIGLDVCLSILETLVEETGDAKYRPAHLLKKYVRAGKLGRKTGAGFYNYRKRG